MENYFFQSKLHQNFWLSAPSGGSLNVLLHTASFILDPATVAGAAQDNYSDKESEDNDSDEEGDIDEDMMDID